MRALSIALARKCAGIIAGVVDAMHVSRSIEARRVIHDRRHLLDDGSGALPLDIASIHHNKEDISEHANGFDTEPCGYFGNRFERG
jgi:hypothetical protein